jgi:hypothetical protein
MTIGNSPDMNYQRETGLRLRRRVVKLRWMGLDGEADRAATEVSKIECVLPPAIPSVPAETD